MDSWIPTRIELARPVPPLTYLAPPGVLPGVRVQIKVRNAAAVGVVLGPDPQPPDVKLKAVEAVLDPFPLLPPRLRELLEFAARYYGCGVAHLMALCLPQAVVADWAVPLGEGLRLQDLRDEGRWDRLAELGEAWHRGERPLPALFHRRGLRGAGVTEVRRTDRPHPAKVTVAQARVLLALEDEGGAMLEDALLDAAKVGLSVLAGLERAGLVERVRRLDLLSQKRDDDAPDKRVDLNGEQLRAVGDVDLDQFGAYLLFGVTGSGKTEVYLELAQRTLAAGRRVLWLVPEIGLTPRLLSRLEARFPGRVAVGHAGLNASEKQADVLRLLQDDAPAVRGGAQRRAGAPAQPRPDRGGRGAGGLVQERGAPPHPRPGPGGEAGPAGGLPGGAGQRHPVPGELARRPAGPLPAHAPGGAPGRGGAAHGEGGGPARVLQGRAQAGDLRAAAAQGHGRDPGAGRAEHAPAEPPGLRELLDVPGLRARPSTAPTVP